MTTYFPPEGRLLSTPENQAACADLPALYEALHRQTLLEGLAIQCSEDHDLVVSVGPFTGFIPRLETALGIPEGTTRDIAILSRVGKPVSFFLRSIDSSDPAEPRLLLSRRQAQEQALEEILDCWVPGQIIPATVTHLEPFGAFVDIGCGLPSMIGVERLSISRIGSAADRFTVGQDIYAVVTGLDRSNGRVLLSHRELLGTWEENAALFRPGMTVIGTVRSVKDYGIFVELTPNLSGLAEGKSGLRPGDRVSVYIKTILPQQMKLKLVILEALPPAPPAPLRYFLTEGILDRWRYGPLDCLRDPRESVFRG